MSNAIPIWEKMISARKSSLHSIDENSSRVTSTLFQQTIRGTTPIGVGTLDMEKEEFSSKICPSDYIEGNAMFALKIRLLTSTGPSKFVLGYELDEDAIRGLEHWQSHPQIRPSAHNQHVYIQPKKQSSFMSNVNKFLYWERTFNLMEILSEDGNLSVGNAEDEQLVIDSLGSKLGDVLYELNQSVRDGQKGRLLVDMLLNSDNPEYIRLGLFLVPDHMRGALYRRLITLSERPDLPESIRRAAQANLSPRKRREVLSREAWLLKTEEENEGRKSAYEEATANSDPGIHGGEEDNFVDDTTDE